MDDFNLSITEGQILGLIGPNGAGKSTVFNCIAGVYPATDGEIFFDGDKVNNVRPWNLCKQGLGSEPFRSSNRLHPRPCSTTSWWEATLPPTNTRWPKARPRGPQGPESRAKKDVKAGNLTIADRKRLEIARALATEPKLLLLDEVMAGLRPTEVDEMVKIIRGLRDSGITIFIIEHIMRAIMALSDWIVVIHFGRKISEGPRRRLPREKVIKAYLGEDYGVS